VVLAGEISLASAISSLDWVSSHERYGRNRYNDQLKALGAQLKPNTSLLLAVVDGEQVAEVVGKLRSANGRVISEGLSEDAIDQLAMSDFATDSAARSAVVAAMDAEAAPEPAQPVQAEPAPSGQDAAR
jgi:hypothetical protein